MAKKSGNFVVRLILLVLVAGAIFFALDHFLTPKSKTENAEGTPEASSAPPGTETPGAAPAAQPALTREQAEQIGRDVGTRIGTEVGTQVGQQIAQEMLAQREAKLASKKSGKKKPAEAAPAPAETVAAAPPPEAAPAPATPPTPAPAPEATAAAPTPEPAPAPAAEAPAGGGTAPAAAEAPAPPKKPKKKGPAPVLPGLPTVAPESSTWWDKSLSSDKNALVLDFAGGMKGSAGTAVALVFRGRFDSTSDVPGHVVVKNQNGSPMPGEWKLGARQGMVYLPAIPGQYEVTITEGLKDADGHIFSKTLSGSVTVNK